MASKEVLVLNILAREGREMTGFEIVDLDTSKRLGRGSIHSILYRLLLLGEVESREETNQEIMARLKKHGIEPFAALPLHFYKITTGGRKRLIDQGQTRGGNFRLQGA